MINKIIDALNTEQPAVKAVQYGQDIKNNSAYCVVKQENEAAGRGTAFRIIAHFPPGTMDDLNDYIRETVSNALDGFIAASRHGNYNRLYYEESGQMPELILHNDDGTISMERVYYMPDKLF